MLKLCLGGKQSMCMKILSFGCKKILAFPLQIVANSELVKRNGIDYV